MFNADRWAEIPSVVNGIIALSGLAPAAGESASSSGDRAPTVLDMCCGPGRHALEFARRAYRVTGVDITKPYLDAARESAEADGLSAEFILADAREFRRPGSFSLALNLFTSFGYFKTPEEDLAMLRCIFESLIAGGSLVMEMIGKETAARDFLEGEWFERDGRLILTEFQVVGAWEGLKNRWIIVDGARIVDRSWVQRLYSATELRAALFAVGFKKVDLYGSFDGTAYGPEAKSLVAVAVKQA